LVHETEASAALLYLIDLQGGTDRAGELRHQSLKRGAEGGNGEQQPKKSRRSRGQSGKSKLATLE